MTTTDTAAAIREAERAIRAILIDLENDHGVSIEEVRVDTRQFANCSVEIFTDEDA